ncbi:putative protein family UPF0261 [Cordyceps fumosorosea ARSEF 2679]|uniref:Uncharacterized protein n=1 Tax=Cordyceps fumosorosea (strain ARSEF 2679) TaxID=1081104 RepID=A0A167SB53_CORFA|nr:putative protein family UPF0261 [Cordyceps fumosorosea ARSEF 2679]OAA59443.1 putative protein family UPF0261 [Cordyceps fumosorosea ARSEF 2679]
MPTVAVIGTCDTKFDELRFLRDRVRDHESVDTIMIDVGWRATEHSDIAMSQQQLIAKYGEGKDVSSLPRGEFITFISACAAKAVKDLYENRSIDGIVSAGGSGGTSLVSSVMRDVLPIGFPKLIVSTIASGDTEPIVGETDIALMYSVVDVAGLNHVLRGILSNAGAAIGAAAVSFSKTRAADAEHDSAASSEKKKRVGITMFGVTTPGVDAIRAHLEGNYPIETYVFHATGRGGKAMERLVREGTLDAVVDLTTTEIADFVVGGVMPAGEDRLDAAVQRGIPNIVSLGATDMVNFGARRTVPPVLAEGRAVVEHNPLVTLVRTSPEECTRIGEFIAGKLARTERPDATQVWIPRGGVSSLAGKGKPFADAAADEALFEALRKGLKDTGIEIIEDDRDVNDVEMAKEIAVSLARKLGLES